MRPQRFHTPAFVAGVLTLCASIYLIILAKPHCDDGNLKTLLLGIGLFGQFLFVGTLSGYLARTGGWWHGFLVAVVACPIISAMWLDLLWGWNYFLPPFYWSIASGFFIAGIPLTMIGGLLGSVLYSKVHLSSSRAAS